jgi:HTH-type transcriptional regulator/antitoxin HigA
MNIFPIRNDDDLTRALKRIDELWNTEHGTPEGDELDIWMDLVEAYQLYLESNQVMDLVEAYQLYLESNQGRQA